MKKVLSRAKKLLNNHPNWLVILVLALLSIVAYGQTYFMYFLIDDNALIYKLQHFDQNVGLWGRGIFGEGPYRHIVDQFIPFYPLFGINPTPYFTIGIFLYFLTATSIYFFLKILTKNNLVALSTAIIFASGYVGSETMFGIVNSWQTTRGIIIFIFTLLLFFQYIRSKNLLFYILSVGLFFLSIDTVFIRAHGLIFIILAFDLLFWPVKLNWRSLLAFILRQGPFLIAHYYVYVSSPNLIERFAIKNLIKDIFIEGKINLIFIPLQNIGNLFIPDILTSRIDNFVSNFILIPQSFYLGSTVAGTIFALMFLIIFLKWKNKQPVLTRLLLFSFILIMGNIIVYFTRETGLVLHTTHRYFSYSFVGLSLFWALLAIFIFKATKKYHLSVSLIIIVSLVYLWLGVNYQYSFNQKRSFPAKRFFTAFDREVPNIPKGAILYFDIANDNQVKGEFGNFFGGIFSEGSNLSIYSENIDYMTDFTFTYKFDDIEKALKNGTATIEKIYTFYYGKNGLVNTTDQARSLLKTGKAVKIESLAFDSQNSSSIVVNPPISTPSIIPTTLTFTLTVKPYLPTLPYISKNSTEIDPIQKTKILSYLVSQNSFRKETTVTSASFWKDQESKYLTDGRLDTSWRGHRGFWDEIDRGRSKDIEFVILDLGKVAKVNKLIWVSGFYQLVPTYYRILTSIDGQKWQIAKEVNKRQYLSPSIFITDEFNPRPTRLLKMEILKTYGNDGPEIQEMEVVEERFSDLDQNAINQVKQNPFGRIDNLTEYEETLNYLKQNAMSRLRWMSDADLGFDPNKYIDFPILIDGNPHLYSVDLPSSGLNWLQFRLEGFNFPAEINLGNAIISFESIIN